MTARSRNPRPSGRGGRQSVEHGDTAHPSVVISLDLERRVADGLKAFAEAFERA